MDSRAAELLAVLGFGAIPTARVYCGGQAEEV